VTRVVVLGDVATDVVVRPRTVVVAHSDTPSDIRTGLGGAGANVACGLAAEGLEIRLVGRIGRDPTGRARRTELADRGVDLDLAEDPEHPTGTVVVIVDPDGRRTMYPDRGANRWLADTDVAGDWAVTGGHLHVSGYLLLDAPSRSAARTAMSRARSAGMTCSVDPSSVGPLAAAGVERFLNWTGTADLCLPNLDEARLLAGDPEATAESAAAALAQRYAEVVVTAGAAGAVWASRHRHVVRAAPAARVVDTTGAGDAFVAGFLAGWLDAARVSGSGDAGAAALARARSGLERGLLRARAAVEILGSLPRA
jgi:ribokinase